MENNLRYWHPLGFLNAKVGETSQNGVEFLILHWRLSKILNNPSVFHAVDYWINNANRSEEDRHTPLRLGHDNLTAVYSYRKADHRMAKLALDLNTWYRPDYQYYCICHGAKSWWRYALLSLAIIYGALVPWKFRRINGKWHRFKKTDGLLLTWLRFRGGLNMPMTQKIVNFFVDRYFGSWYNVFATYFEEGHPILQFNQEEYEL